MLQFFVFFLLAICFVMNGNPVNERSVGENFVA